MIQHKGTKKLETERLILRKFEAEDAFDMYKNWASDSEVTKYLSWQAHNDIKMTKQLIGFWINNYKNNNEYQWAIQYKETSEVVGNINLLEVYDKDENCEVGYCLGRKYWSKGIVSEALFKVLEYGFEEVGFQRIAAHVEAENLASWKVMEKCNMVYEGTFRNFVKNNNGSFSDCRYYSILKDEYKKVDEKTIIKR